MAVYKKTYRPYEGELTPAWSRLFVIPRYAFEDLHHSRFLTIFYIATFIYPLICALIIYVQHNLSALKLLNLENTSRLILSTHLLRDVEECCDEVLILKDGNIAAFCNLEEERRANRRFLEIETRGENNGSFIHSIEQLGCETAPGAQGRIKLVLPDGLEVRRLYELAAQQNVQIRRLNHKRDSLEDIFLKAMETANGRL